MAFCGIYFSVYSPCTFKLYEHFMKQVLLIIFIFMDMGNSGLREVKYFACATHFRKVMGPGLTRQLTQEWYFPPLDSMVCKDSSYCCIWRLVFIADEAITAAILFCLQFDIKVFFGLKSIYCDSIVVRIKTNLQFLLLFSSRDLHAPGY